MELTDDRHQKRRRRASHARHGERSAPARSAGDLLDLVALTPEGLGVLKDGTLVRALEVEALNPLVEDEARVEQLSKQLHHVNIRIPAGQSLLFFVQSAPLALDQLVTRETGYCRRAATAFERGGDPDAAEATRRFGFAQTHSLQTLVPGVSASSLRFVVFCPWRPRQPPLAGLPRRERVFEVEETVLEEAVEQSDRYASQIATALGGADVSSRRLDGAAILDLLWSRFSPNRADAGELPPSLTHPNACGDLTAARTPEEAAVLAAHLREAICQEDIRHHALTAIEFGAREGDDDAVDGDPDDRGRAPRAGSREQTFRLATVPEQTWLGWVMHLMQAEVPWTLAVHVHGTDRGRERRRERARMKRLRGINRGTAQRGRDVDPEQEEREAESREVNATMAAQAGATIQRVSMYLALRVGHDSDRRLEAEGEALAKELLAATDARLDPGRFAQLPAWRSTLPLGRDYLPRRARRYLSQNAADSIPLVSTGCGSPVSPTWMPLGFSGVGRTLEGLDPFDREHSNHVTLVAARGGGGKTMLLNVLLSRALAKGARGTVIERGGHFSTLASAHPNAAVRKLGGADGHALNPWDGEPTDAKLSFLLALHDLMIGEQVGLGEHALGIKRRSLLSIAIRAVYDRCRLSGETPREQLLQEELHKRAIEAKRDGSAELANDYQTLELSLTNFVGDGPYGWLADRLTSTDGEGLALEVWDTRDIPDAVSPAALFTICEKAIRRVEAQRERFLAGERDGRPWDGRSFLVIDEAWKLLDRPSTGRWVRELALRSRHIALWLVAISQRLDHFATEEGKALISQAVMKIFLRTSADQLADLQEKVGLTDQETHAIGELRTVKREFSTCFFINGTRGRGTLTISVSDLEYWLSTSDPVNDEPIRADAMREAAAESATWCVPRPPTRREAEPPSGTTPAGPTSSEQDVDAGPVAEEREAALWRVATAAARGGDGTPRWLITWSGLKKLAEPDWHRQRDANERAESV